MEEMGNNEGNKGEENGKQCVEERKTTGKEYGEPWEGQWEENGKNSMEKMRSCWGNKGEMKEKKEQQRDNGESCGKKEENNKKKMERKWRHNGETIGRNGRTMVGQQGTIVRVHGWKIGEQWEEQSC